MYDSPKILAILGVLFFFIVLSFGISAWRRKLKNPMTKKLSSSWSSASFWFGITGIILVVCRVEDIQFMSMRVLWLILFLIALLYIVVQVMSFRRRHYVVMDKMQVVDERDKYLPRKK